MRNACCTVCHLRGRYGTPRRSALVKGDTGEILATDVIPNDPCFIMYSRKGYIKRMPADAFALQNRGTRGMQPMHYAYKSMCMQYKYSTSRMCIHLCSTSKVCCSSIRTGRQGGRMREDDALDSMLSAHAHDPIMIFTQDGVVRSLPAYQVPEASRASGGTALAQVCCRRA